MNRYLILIFLIFGCSSKNPQPDGEKGVQRMEEESASHWLIDPFKFNCTRYPLTVEELSEEFENITKSNCTVSVIDTHAGPVRSFECGDTTWFVTESESTCQAAVSALKLPDTTSSIWMLVPGQPQCQELAGSLGQILQGLEKETEEDCNIKQFISTEPSSRYIECGQKNWIVSEDPATCQRLQDAYNEHTRHSI